MHPLILNHREAMAAAANGGGLTNAMPQAFAKILEDIIARFLELHGAEIIPDQSRVMTGPVGLTEDGRVLTAKTRKYAVRYDFEGGDTIDTIVDGIYKELSEEIKALQPGQHFYPYQLVCSGGVMIDPTTFSPNISFLVRYAIA